MINNPHFALNNGGESFRQLSNLLKSNENKTVRRFQGCTICLLNGRTYTLCFKSAVVAMLIKARDDELESDDRSASSLASSNPGGAAFANCILGVALAKLRKRDFR